MCKSKHKGTHEEHLLRKRMQYANNVEFKNKKVEASRKFRRHREIIIKIAKDRPCMDCGIKYPPFVMDFDHIFDKTFGIGQEGSRKSIEDLLEEINKCEIVCSNCHRFRSEARRLQRLKEAQIER